MGDTLFGVGAVTPVPQLAYTEEDERVAHVFQQAEDLLADLGDTALERPLVARGTSDSLDVFDIDFDDDDFEPPTEIYADEEPYIAEPPAALYAEQARVDDAYVEDTYVEDPDDVGLATLTTMPAGHPLRVAPVHPQPRSPSVFGRMLARIRQWFGVKPAAVDTYDDEDYGDGSCAWTYTVSERRVAQVRDRRRY